MARTFTAPTFRRVRGQKLYIGRFVAFMIFTIIVYYAGYNGWITPPSFAIIGENVGWILIAIGLITMAVILAIRRGIMAPLLGVAMALVVGGLIVANWNQFQGAFIGFAVSDLLGLILAIIVVLVLGVWFFRRPVVATEVVEETTVSHT